jgi:carbon-monoxide dehydrogenase small subunit
MKVSFILNGKPLTVDVAPGEYLVDTLRNNHVLSVKKACNESSCGACSVLVDDKVILSCSYLTQRVEGKKVLTVEGIQKEADKLSDYFSDQGADQCGFCNTGLALTIHALRKELKNPTDEDIKNFVVANLCRCTGYQAQFLAIKNYLEAKK